MRFPTPSTLKATPLSPKPVAIPSPTGQSPQSNGSATDDDQLNRFSRTWLFVTLLLTASIAGLNWLIDPYGIYKHSPTIYGFNQVKPERANRDRLVRAVGILHQQPKHLVIGSSRTKQGINPDHDTLALPGYNASLDGISSYELKRYIEHAIATQPDLQQVTVGVDFFMFNDAVNSPTEAPNATEASTAVSFESQPVGNVQSGFAEYRIGRSHLSPKDILSTTFSLDAITSSYTTVTASHTAPNEKPENPNGFTPHSTATDKDTLWRFRHDLRIFFSRHHQFALSTDTLQDFAQIVQMCEDAGLELTVFISPAHAVQWEAVAKTSSWDLFEQWKRELVAITPVWDFSGYSTVTTETVRSGMTYYRDNSHYRPVVGDWVLKRMFGTALTQAEIPEDFGVLLTPDTVDTHLATIRQDRQQWRRQNASVLTWVQDIKESALGTQSATSASLVLESDLAPQESP